MISPASRSIAPKRFVCIICHLCKDSVKHNYITEKQLIDTLRIQLGIEYIDLSKVDITPEMSRYVPKPGENIIQTAPYYDEDGNVGKIQGQNPFGPRK